jgi:hypothetical protein
MLCPAAANTASSTSSTAQARALDPASFTAARPNPCVLDSGPYIARRSSRAALEPFQSECVVKVNAGDIACFFQRALVVVIPLSEAHPTFMPAAIREMIQNSEDVRFPVEIRTTLRYHYRPSHGLA